MIATSLPTSDLNDAVALVDEAIAEVTLDSADDVRAAVEMVAAELPALGSLLGARLDRRLAALGGAA